MCISDHAHGIGRAGRGQQWGSGLLQRRSPHHRIRGGANERWDLDAGTLVAQAVVTQNDVLGAGNYRYDTTLKDGSGNVISSITLASGASYTIGATVSTAQSFDDTGNTGFSGGSGVTVTGSFYNTNTNLTSAPATTGGQNGASNVRWAAGNGLAPTTLASTGNLSTVDYSTTPTDPAYSGGTLTLGSAQSIDSLQIASGSGGTLDLGNTTLTITNNNLGMTGTGNYTIQDGNLGASGTMVVVNQGGSGTLNINTPISGGSGGFVKLGTGTVVLGASSSYAGATVLGGGVLNLGVAEGASAGPMGHGGTILFTGGTLQYSSSNTTDYSSRFGTGATQKYSVDTNGQNVTWATALNSTGGSLTKGGNGVLTLSASNGYSGGTAVNGGTLAISGSGTLGSGSAITLGGGTLDLGATGQTVGAVSITAAAATGNTIQNGSLTGTSYAASNTSGSAIVTANLLVDGSAGFTKSGAGIVTLSGSNTYSGSTTISGGIVNLGATEGGSSGPLGHGGSIVFAGGTLQYSSANQYDYSSRFGTGANQAYNVDTNGQNVTWATALNSTGGSLTKGGNGVLTLSASNGYSGGTAVNGGTLAISGSGTLGSGSAITLGGGTLDLGATGQTVGAVSITAAAATGNTIQNGSLTGTSYAASNTSGSAIVTANLLVDGSAGFTKSGAGIVTLSGSNTYSGSTTISGGIVNLGTAESGSSGPLGHGGSILFAGGTLQYSSANQYDYSSRFGAAAGQAYSVDTNGQNVTWAGALSSSTGSLTKLGSGTLTLTGAPSYSAQPPSASAP